MTVLLCQWSACTPHVHASFLSSRVQRLTTELLVCSSVCVYSAAVQLSTVLGAAIPEERHEKKWIEGIAIWAAIFLVTLVSKYMCSRLRTPMLGSAHRTSAVQHL
jgi:cyanate permease